LKLMAIREAAVSRAAARGNGIVRGVPRGADHAIEGHIEYLLSGY
jgi:hypothetical protein